MCLSEFETSIMVDLMEIRKLTMGFNIQTLFRRGYKRGFLYQYNGISPSAQITIEYDTNV